MIVLYLLKDRRFLQAIRGFPKVKEDKGKLLLDGTVIINDLSKAGYVWCEDKTIHREYEDIDGEPVEKDLFIDDLGLVLTEYKEPRDFGKEIDDLKDKVTVLEDKAKG